MPAFLLHGIYLATPLCSNQQQVWDLNLSCGSFMEAFFFFFFQVRVELLAENS